MIDGASAIAIGRAARPLRIHDGHTFWQNRAYGVSPAGVSLAAVVLSPASSVSVVVSPSVSAAGGFGGSQPNENVKRQAAAKVTRRRKEDFMTTLSGRFFKNGERHRNGPRNRR